ncbi:aldehyde dehydrogenase family 2 member C4-like [Dendrobium catenatum]|uniref:aldehyde dehydrogenase family 2 member C4-like n=1 Tax=Dendrobium catenatum TaxID=906689 RepID=UPI00109F4E28|nr:aldehyde dehydrogenase family 2 member C4-like [Dendrobium catenatum]
MASESNGVSKLKTPEIKFAKLFINGQFIDSVSGKKFETIDPRTGEMVTQVAEGDKEDVDIAVKAAREAFDHGKWPRISGFERGRILFKLADLIDQHGEEIAMLDSIDAGKLLHITRAFDIPFAANCFRYYGGAADKIHGETLKCAGEFQAYTLKEPVGVVGHIIPWNFPTVLFAAKVAAALASGCTMVVKPAEQSPLSALYLAHLAKEAGIPDGVINVITGYGPTAGAAIASHMDVDAVSFTGSTEVGKLVMGAAAASNLKIVSLELGGKSPLIIFSDADIDMAVQTAWQAVFFNQDHSWRATEVRKVIVW